MKRRGSQKSPSTLNELGSGLLHHENETHSCNCHIVPKRVLDEFANDPELTAQQRQYFADAAKLEQDWRRVRTAAAKFARTSRQVLPTGLTTAVAAAAPTVLVFDCNHGVTLPGTPVANPASSSDQTAKRTFNETTAVARFFQTIFGRNSLDNAGMTLQSSIHYGVNYNNAAWTGTRMFYGDGDGNIFVDFTKSTDVIGHELTHGLTQFSAGFVYSNEPGGLNESMSDVFGSMFRQWRANQTVSTADWLIGKDIMGPGALARGYTCLRDMANPAAAHCLAPQPTKFSQYQPGMDPHESSGIPNFAFYKAAKAIGGRSWDKTGKIWYRALTGYPPSPNMKMKDFADRTRAVASSLYPANPAIKAAVHKAWKAVGL